MSHLRLATRPHYYMNSNSRLHSCGRGKVCWSMSPEGVRYIVECTLALQCLLVFEDPSSEYEAQLGDWEVTFLF